MATRRYCDCGCGMELAEHDAGKVPLMVAGPHGSTIEVRVHPGPSGPPMLRPACARKIAEKGDLLFPRVPREVDPGVEERSERGAAIPLPRKAEAGA